MVSIADFLFSFVCSFVRRFFFSPLKVPEKGGGILRRARGFWIPALSCRTQPHRFLGRKLEKIGKCATVSRVVFCSPGAGRFFAVPCSSWRPSIFALVSLPVASQQGLDCWAQKKQAARPTLMLLRELTGFFSNPPHGEKVYENNFWSLCGESVCPLQVCGYSRAADVDWSSRLLGPVIGCDWPTDQTPRCPVAAVFFFTRAEVSRKPPRRCFLEILFCFVRPLLLLRGTIVSRGPMVHIKTYIFKHVY